MKLVKGNTIRLNGDDLQLYSVQQCYHHGQSHLFIGKCYQAEAINDRRQPADLEEHDLAYLFGVDEMEPYEIWEDHDAYRAQLLEEREEQG